MPRRKLAVIGANEFQEPLIRRAKELGFETHVFAWAAGDVGEAAADVFHPISIVEKDAILGVCREVGVEACCSIGSDLATLTVNHVQRALGKPCNPPITDRIATNKFAMREALAAAGVPCPGFRAVDGVPAEADLADLRYPLIVKPTDRSGSRGIYKVRDYAELCRAVPAAIEPSFEKRAVIEEFLEGEEFSCESVSFAGEHHFLALTKKHTTGAPHFIETGHDEPADLPPETQAAIFGHIRRGLDALHIETGAAHAEFMLRPDGGVRLVEIGARMGGDCIGSDLVYLSTGIDFVGAVIAAACGEAPDLRPTRDPVPASVRFIFTESDRDVLDRVLRDAPETIWRYSRPEGELSGTVTDSSTRRGWWITAGTPTP